jgi:hypothetical protein
LDPTAVPTLLPTTEPTPVPTSSTATTPAPTPRPTMPPQVGSIEYQIKNQFSGGYLTLSNNTVGASIIVEPWGQGWNSQRWFKESAGDTANPTHEVLRCKWDDFYLDAAGIENNAEVGGWDYQTDWWSFMWSIKHFEGNLYQIVSLWSDRCLTAVQTNDGHVDVTIRDCRSFWTAQRWAFERVRL